MLARLKLPGPQKVICRYWWSNKYSLFPMSIANTRSTTWATEKNMPILWLEPHNLFPKATGNTRSTTWAAERNISILGLEPTQFISEEHCQHAFNYLGCRKEDDGIGTRTNTVYFRRLLATRVQLPGLQKGICLYRASNHHSLFPKAIANTLATTWAAERKMRILGQEPHSLFPKLLATRVQLLGMQKEICRCWDSYQHSLFPKATGNTRTTTWAAERNTSILGLEPTQFISEGYCQHAFKNLGCRKK